MKDLIISKFTAAKLVKQYYIYRFLGLVNVKVKIKIQGNDMTMVVKLTSVVNHKKVVEIVTLNEGEIMDKICEYMEYNYCNVCSISTEPYFHNISVKYEGDYDITNKNETKPFLKMKRVFN